MNEDYIRKSKRRYQINLSVPWNMYKSLTNLIKKLQKQKYFAINKDKLLTCTQT